MTEQVSVLHVMVMESLVVGATMVPALTAKEQGRTIVMPKQVNGFLAEDGTFFENEPECKRYENMKFLETLCATHELNYENFIAVINAWHQQIKGYYNADDACQVKQTKQDNTLDFRPKFDDTFDRDTAGDSSLSSIEGYYSNPPSGDKDAPGFLEQSFGRHK